MLKIRLQRVGRKHEPSFRLVLTDSQNSSKSGRFKEILGSYDPRKTSDSLNTERINYWLSQGAQPTDTVHNLLVNHKVIDAKKRNVLPKKTYTPPPAAENDQAPMTNDQSSSNDQGSNDAEAQDDAVPAEGQVEAPAPADAQDSGEAKEEPVEETAA